MEQKNNLSLFEYMSLALVLSFFVNHNIYLVLIGIIFSLYSLNKKHINKYINININKYHESKIIDSEVDGLSQSNYDNKKIIKQNSDISLVEKIEELGYIPKSDSINDTNAA
ncbi:hypothetical protein [Prochlorococcus marinus]|uniref:Uncharacterized protein n=1 Tax=Prochlorococcus marinus XMU1408 TaxID=2213228 RepID=A0A318R2H4_PROMR|nr:hypothetical protein [Prochlorococcus marinus]MBW3042396.1 hypothetical protein [Prochlorococcus marinus str. XMU1408]PYE01131.1 hypothetical protein DNJ73_06795 [Prochlorococcus marinus XMU1408]